MSHWLDGDFLVLQHTGLLLGIEESSRWKLVHLIARVRDLRHFTLNHLLNCLARRAVELYERREGERERSVCVHVCVCVCVV